MAAPPLLLTDSLTCMHMVLMLIRSSNVSGWPNTRSVSFRRRRTLAADESRRSRWLRKAVIANSFSMIRFWRAVMSACHRWGLRVSAVAAPNLIKKTLRYMLLRPLICVMLSSCSSMCCPGRQARTGRGFRITGKAGVLYLPGSILSY